MAELVGGDRPKRLAQLVMGGAGLLVFGSLLPWATVTAPFIGQVSVSGTEGDGVITILMGAGLLFLGYRMLAGASRRALLTAVVVAALAVALVVFEFADISSAAADGGEDLAGLVDASPAIGLYFCAMGAVAALVGAIQRLRLGAPPTVS